MSQVFRPCVSVLLVWMLLCAIFTTMASAQVRIVKETVRGTIFRYIDSHVTVDQYTLEITESSALVEFDILSAETKDNRTFTDVNQDCDSAFIDSQIYLYYRNPESQKFVVVAFNDDEGDDSKDYLGKGRRDGSLDTTDSYMIRRLKAGTYMLAVGRFPLQSMSARAGRSTEAVNSYSPYSCRTQQANYGNYQLTLRVQSGSSKGIITKYANSYVGNSCTTTNSNAECVYKQPGDVRQAIMSACSYDKTII